MDRSSPKRLRALLRISYWAAPLLACAALAVGWRTQGNEVMSPGPLSREHALFGKECERCHAVAFGGLGSGAGSSAMNGACLDCHGHRLAADPIAPNVRHGHSTPIDAKLACSECHHEHRGPADPKGDAACVDCHRRASKPIAFFGDVNASAAHPDFQRPSDSGTIRFNHKLHTGGGGAAARVSLACGECHQAGAQGEDAYQSPIEFRRHCARCHEITASVGAKNEARVPHGRPEEIHALLTATRDAASAEAAERALYGNQDGCAKCHSVVKGPTDGNSPVLAPSGIPKRWYERARFDHRKHSAIAFHGSGTGNEASCAYCHSPVLASTRSTDVSIPGKAVCTQCHGEGRGVPGRCDTCHTFHEGLVDGASAYKKLDPALVADGERETRFGMRGSKALWPKRAFDSLPTAIWGKPLTPGSEEFQREIYRRYGLFAPDFPNDGLPMGLIKVAGNGKEDGITLSCDLCHSSSLFGKIVPGQPNRFCDIEQLWIDLSKVNHEREADPLYFKTPHRNTIINGADQLGLLGLVMRNGDLSTDVVTALRVVADRAADLKPEFDALAYVKTPPWYVYRTKQDGAAGYYFDGGHPKDGNFAAFTYLVSFWEDVRGALWAWQRSGHTYLASLAAPRYPFAIDQERALRGRRLYDANCARCHGRYEGAAATPENLVYPGVVIPASEVGTDPMRADFPLSFGRRVRTILHETYTFTRGYVAQPLTAIWAQAPYLHNGSVPTLAQLLEPSRRLGRFALTADPNDPDAFDQVEVGWRVGPVQGGQEPGARVFDPSLTPGLGNQGHTFGSELTGDERADLLEFLKTL